MRRDTSWFRVVLLLGMAGATLVLSGGGTLAANSALDAHGRAISELIALTNADRTTNGLAALVVDDRLTSIAQARSDDMAAHNYLAHEIPPDGHTVFDILARQGLPGVWGGENIHSNNLPATQSVGYAARALMRSPEHRAIILDPREDSVGAGLATDAASGRQVYTILFAELGATNPSSVPEVPQLTVVRPEGATPLLGPGPAASAAPVVPVPGRGIVDDLVRATLRVRLGL